MTESKYQSRLLTNTEKAIFFVWRLRASWFAPWPLAVVQQDRLMTSSNSINFTDGFRKFAYARCYCILMSTVSEPSDQSRNAPKAQEL